MTITDSRVNPGDVVHVVFLSDQVPSIAGGRVLLDRGRGIVIDLDENSDVVWHRNTRVLLAFQKNDEIWSMKGRVSEVLADRRGYVQPSGDPIELDKREFIRSVVRVPATVLLGGAVTGGLHESSVELSSSGFRLLTQVSAEVGQSVNLAIDLGEELGVVVQPSKVIRVEDRGGRNEMAGRFEQPEPKVSEAITRLVFRSCLVGLGLGIEAWD